MFLKDKQRKVTERPELGERPLKRGRKTQQNFSMNRELENDERKTQEISKFPFPYFCLNLIIPGAVSSQVYFNY